MRRLSSLGLKFALFIIGVGNKIKPTTFFLLFFDFCTNTNITKYHFDKENWFAPREISHEGVDVKYEFSYNDPHITDQCSSSILTISGVPGALGEVLNSSLDP